MSSWLQNLNNAILRTGSHRKVYVPVWEIVSDIIVGHFSSPPLSNNKCNEILLNSIMISLPVVPSLLAKFQYATGEIRHLYEQKSW